MDTFDKALAVILKHEGGQDVGFVRVCRRTI